MTLCGTFPRGIVRFRIASKVVRGFASGGAGTADNGDRFGVPVDLEGG